MLPATSPSIPPTIAYTIGVTQMTFQLRHCTMHVQRATTMCMAPKKRAVQIKVKRQMSSGS